MDLNEVGRRIKDRRKYMNLTQKDVADMVNTSQSNYARYEAGEIDLSMSTITSLAKALAVPISYFFDGPDDEWAPDDGPTEAYFRGLPPESGDIIRAMLKAAHEEAQRKQKVHGRKAE